MIWRNRDARREIAPGPQEPVVVSTITPVPLTRELFAAFDPRLVVVSSPHDPQECFRRLAKVTTDRGGGWYLDPKTAMLPDPRFRGEVGSSWLRVARFRDASRRQGGLMAVLDASIEPVPGGGTTLRGTVGPARNNAPTMLAFAAIFATIGVGLFVGGVVDIARGHFVNSLPFVLIPCGLIAFAIFVVAPGKRMVGVMLENIFALLTDVTQLLDATSTFPD
jgi:hypothetical protein